MRTVEDFYPVFVSHHQFEIFTGWDEDALDLYTAGDDFLQVTGAVKLTVLTGLHTGTVRVRARVLDRGPEGTDGWTVAGEATLWSADGNCTILGLMGEAGPELPEGFLGGPGLFRFQVRGRERRPEGTTENPPPEEYEVLAWPVGQDEGHATLIVDELPRSPWRPGAPGRAASWAMRRLVARAAPSPQRANLLAHGRGPAGRPAAAEARFDLRREVALTGDGADPDAGTGATVGPVRFTSVYRSEPAPEPVDPLTGGLLWLADDVDADGSLLLLAGDVRVRLALRARSAEVVELEWRWEAAPGASAGLPDPQASKVELRQDGSASRLVVHHRGVLGPDITLVGLIWEYLLLRARSPERLGPNPWVGEFDRIAVEKAQKAQARRRTEVLQEARRYGGRPLGDRLRGLRANVVSLATMDRDLLDALAGATPDRQRAVAVRATRLGFETAGLAAVSWIAPALEALERGRSLPPPFDDDQQAWERLLGDPSVPHTTIALPHGSEGFLQQAAAFPAIWAAVAPDPLVAAVDAIHAAAGAHGRTGHRAFLAAIRADFPELGPP
jgi:hypothetical protein